MIFEQLLYNTKNTVMSVMHAGTSLSKSHVVIAAAHRGVVKSHTHSYTRAHKYTHGHNPQQQKQQLHHLQSHTHTLAADGNGNIEIIRLCRLRGGATERVRVNTTRAWW